MTKAYNRINWQNEPSTDTALNEQNLNKMDRAIDVIDDRVCGMEESVQAKVDEAGEKVTDAEAQVKLAQSYAKGGTGSRQGENTDNAMYYRNQARAYAENAEAVVGIGIATPEQAGIVKPDGTSITVDLDGTIHVSAISEQSNPNLLDNPFFTVNQRGGKILPIGKNVYSDVPPNGLVGATVNVWRVIDINSNTALVKNPQNDATAFCYTTDVIDGYVEHGYTVDRWLNSISSTAPQTVKVLTDGVKISSNGTSVPMFRQPISNIESLFGKTITISLKATIPNGKTIRFGTRTANYQYWDFVGTGEEEIYIRTYVLDSTSGSNYIFVQPLNRDNTEYFIHAMKLEIGNVSTLANDIAPNYAEELLKCMMSTADSADTYANKRIATRYDDQNTFSEAGIPHYEDWRAKLQFNVDGDSAFKWICGSRQFPTKVDLANEFLAERKSGVSLNSLFINSRNTFKVYVMDADCSNAPSGFIGGWLEACTLASQASTSLVEQTLHNADGRVWTRRYYLGVWTEWLSVSANVITTSAPTEGAVSAYPIGTTIDVIE